MRKILFRGKKKSSGDWVEGIPIQHSDGDWQIHGGYSNAGYLSTVATGTICQYTGLTDKNGRKIFEGDILSGVRYDDRGQDGEYLPDKCVIKWDEKRAAFAPVYWWDGYSYDLMNYEVIGNIFDNPDMIKGK